MSYYSIKGAPFRYKGAHNVEQCQTAQEVMEAAHLDWEVGKCELIAKMPANFDIDMGDEGFIRNLDHYLPINNQFAVYRKDLNYPLGLVKDKYTPVQNSDAFKFFDNAIGKDKAIWQTAGYFGAGERIFVSAKLPKTISVKGDQIDNYLVFTTSHDGSSGVKILFTPIRVVCQNTLNAAIRSTTNYVSFRHTSNVHSNLDIAGEILGICENKIEELNQEYNHLLTIKMDDKDAYNAFAKVILTDKEINNIKQNGYKIDQIIHKNWRALEDSEISMKKANVLSEMTNYYFTGIGQKDYVGTAWGVYNAVTGFYSNVDNNEGTKRMDTLLFGDRANKIEKVGNYLINV